MLVVDTETYPIEFVDKEDRVKNRWGLKRPYVRLVSIAGKSEVYVYDLKDFSEEEKREFIERILEKGVIGHNLSFDLKALWRTLGKIKLPSAVWDTMSHEFFIHSKYRKYGHFSLKAVALRRLKEVISKEEQNSDWSQELTENQLEYASKDAEITREIYRSQVKDLPSIKAIGRKTHVKTRTFCKNEYPIGYALIHEIVPFIALMEYHGIPFDVEKAKEMKETLRQEIEELEAKIEALTGTKKVDSKEFKESFKRMGYSDIKSFSQGEIEKIWHKLSQRQRIVYLLRKELITRKKEEAFIKQALLYEYEGRIYPDWKQLTKTGRIVSSTPNVQNLPKTSKIKSLIRPEDGYVFVSVDFPQIELRIAARWIEFGIKEARFLFPFIEVDRGLMFALKNNEDIHRLTASVIFGKEPEEINEVERKVGKAINFSFLYGGKEAIREALVDTFPEISEELNDEILNKMERYFYQLYPDIEFFHKVMVMTKKEFYSFGGTPIFPFKKTDALNYPIQACGAEILKDVAVRVLKDRKEQIEKGLIKPIMVIHDELVFEVKKSIAEDFSIFLEEIVKNSIELFTNTRPQEDLVEVKTNL